MRPVYCRRVRCQVVVATHESEYCWVLAKQVAPSSVQKQAVLELLVVALMLLALRRVVIIIHSTIN